MKKLLLLPLLLLTACGGGNEVVSETITDERPPTYCIREVIFLDDNTGPEGRLLLDMPGYPYGQTDMMQETNRRTYNLIDWDACKSDDPRTGQKPRGIAWADGRNTDLDGNPISAYE